MDRIGRFECSKKHFTQRFRMSVAPNPSSPVPRYTPQLPHPSVGGRSRRGWQGRRRGRRSCILRSRSGRGAFSSPASRRGGYVHPVHSAGTLSLPILSRDVPDRWNWAGSRSLICIHGTRSRRALPAGWRQQSHSRRLLQTPDFPVESGLRAAWRRSCNAQIHITLDKAIFIIMASYGPGLEFSGTLESAGLSLF